MPDSFVNIPPESCYCASISNQHLTLEWSLEGLTLLDRKRGKIIFRKANSRVYLYSGEAVDLLGLTEKVIEQDKHAVTFFSKTDNLEIKLRCSLHGVYAILELTIINSGAAPIHLGDAQILFFDRDMGALSHLLADPSDVFSLGASTGETEEVWSKGPGNKKVFALRLSKVDPFYTSDNILAARPVNAGELTPEVTFSFDRISEVSSGISIDLERGMSAVRAAFRGAEIPAGGKRVLPNVYVDGISQVQDSIMIAVDRVAAIYCPPVRRMVPAGWCSWYYYYADVSEADIIENLEFLRNNRDRFPYSYVQIDDGYQLHWGDWLLPGQKFPHDMSWLAQRIKLAGLRPGIWVAPLIATEPSHLFHEHPDWALRDFETGEPKKIKGWSPPEENPWVILDGTNPEFVAHIKKIFQIMAHEWGFDYFKIDATAFGGYAGLRYDPTRTGIESVRMVLQAIREAIGPDKYLLGCGVPFGAAIGLVNGERVSDDVSTAFRAEQFGCPIEVSMPQTIHRSFIHGKWWHNDPDCVLVRRLGTPHEPSLRDNGMTLEEAQFFTTVIGLTQGIQMVGERLDALDEERLQLLDRIQPPLEAPAMPQDLFASQPSRLLLRTNNGIIFGLLNWQHTEVSMPVCWSELGLANDEPWHVYELWTQSTLATAHRMHITVKVPAHGSRVLFFRPAVANPTFLGFSGHISCGATLMACEKWNPHTHTLSLGFTANRDGIAKFHVPPGWQPRSSELNFDESGCWSLNVEKGERHLVLEFFKL